MYHVIGNKMAKVQMQIITPVPNVIFLIIPNKVSFFEISGSLANPDSQICLTRYLNVVQSHIYRKGNSCAYKLAIHDHSVVGTIWWDELTHFLFEKSLFRLCAVKWYLHVMITSILP